MTSRFYCNYKWQKYRIKQVSYYVINSNIRNQEWVRWCVWCELQGQSDLLRGAKMDSLDSLRQLALACEACGLTSCSSSNSSSSAISAEHYFSSQPPSGRRSSSHGNGRVWRVSHCEWRKADEGGAPNGCVFISGCTEWMKDRDAWPTLMLSSWSLGDVQKDPCWETQLAQRGTNRKYDCAFIYMKGIYSRVSDPIFTHSDSLQDLSFLWQVNKYSKDYYSACDKLILSSVSLSWNINRIHFSSDTLF